MSASRLYAQEEQFSSLEVFADSRPEWSCIRELGWKGAERFMPFPHELKSMDDKLPEERDEQLENSMGR